MCQYACYLEVIAGLYRMALEGCCSSSDCKILVQDVSILHYWVRLPLQPRQKAFRLRFAHCSHHLGDPSNAVWADPVSTLRWVPLSAYAADGKPATCSKEHAVRWIWGIVRWGSGDFIRTRYRRRLFSTSLQEIWLTGVIYWPMNENAPINHRPYANLLC
jgi:hypothetical protein